MAIDIELYSQLTRSIKSLSRILLVDVSDAARVLNYSGFNHTLFTRCHQAIQHSHNQVSGSMHLPTCTSVVNLQVGDVNVTKKKNLQEAVS
jgi:hypothetical protein